MKRFKFLFCLFVCSFILSMTTTVSASNYSTGKAVIPAFYQGPVDYCWFNVSNITDKRIDVTITFYKQDGTMLTDDGTATGGIITAGPQAIEQAIDYYDNNTDNTVTFSLNAHCSTNINLYFTGSNTAKYLGYGIISWEQDSTALQGLVAHGRQHYLDTNTDPVRVARFAIPINGGLPF